MLHSKQSQPQKYTHVGHLSCTQELLAGGQLPHHGGAVPAAGRPRERDCSAACVWLGPGRWPGQYQHHHRQWHRQWRGMVAAPGGERSPGVARSRGHAVSCVGLFVCPPTCTHHQGARHHPSLLDVQ
eukprot:1151483-Pelagomonas_calceolata.AAC.5